MKNSTTFWEQDSVFLNGTYWRTLLSPKSFIILRKKITWNLLDHWLLSHINSNSIINNLIIGMYIFLCLLRQSICFFMKGNEMSFCRFTHAAPQVCRPVTLLTSYSTEDGLLQTEDATSCCSRWTYHLEVTKSLVMDSAVWVNNNMLQYQDNMVNMCRTCIHGSGVPAWQIITTALPFVINESRVI